MKSFFSTNEPCAHKINKDTFSDWLDKGETFARILMFLFWFGSVIVFFFWRFLIFFVEENFSLEHQRTLASTIPEHHLFACWKKLRYERIGDPHKLWYVISYSTIQSTRDPLVTNLTFDWIFLPILDLLSWNE